MKVNNVLFPTSRKPKKHGFAIVATMTLMILLASVAVGLMALASSQSRIAMQSMLTAAARQQALIGLDAAIGQLQTELGPDQRVSANSGIMSNSNGSNIPNAAYILGVWNSWDGPIYGSSDAGHANSIKTTYDKGRTKMFRRWLISSTNKRDTMDPRGYDSLSSRKPGKRICLVGEGTLGRMGPSNNYIYADLISMPASGSNVAQFAWWVGGENQKAKVNTKDAEKTNDTVELLARTWDTPAAVFSENDQLRFLPNRIEEPSRLLSLGSLPLLADGSREAGAAYFYDVSTSSYSLATDVRNGGLKKDLCLLFNKDNLNGTDFARRTNQDCPIVEQGGDVPQAAERDLPIGSWQTMHAYYNTWPDGSGGDTNFSARLQGGVTGAYTRMSGDLIKAEGGSGYDSKSLLESGSKTAGYARVPIMIAYLSNFIPMTEDHPNADPEEGVGIDVQVSLAFGPTILWWNPYNVPMKVEGKKLWTYTVPYRTLFIQSKIEWKDRGTTDGSDGWAYSALTRKYTNANSSSPEQFRNESFKSDYGSFFVKSFTEASADIEFEAGEVLLFSKQKDMYEVSSTFENHLVLGYHPEGLASNQAHYLASVNACQLEYIEEGYVKFSLRFGIEGDLDAGSNSFKPKTEDVDPWNFTNDYMERIGESSTTPDIAQIPTLAYAYGYDGMSESSDDTDIYNGKEGVSPSQGYLSWYDPKSPPANTTIIDRYTYVTPDQIDDENPEIIASVGFTIKSADAQASTPLVPGDFRSKIWQHSSPVFFGSQIYNPNDEQRAYNPFQLSTLDAGMGGADIANIGNNGTIGVTNNGEQASYVAAAELPVHPPFSLAGFSGMRLTPGWYKQGSSSKFVSRHASMQYQMGVPSNGIGNSFADPTLPMDDIYAKNVVETPDFVKQSGGSSIFNDCYDHGLLINDALWDSFFCSSISDRPLANGKVEAKQVLTEFLSGKSDLPVSRYKKNVTALSDSAVINRLMDSDGWKYVAQYLVIDGGFNVNSTSVEAWTAVLLGLSKRELVSNVSKGQLTKVESSRNDTDVVFSRFMLSTTDKSLDSLGRFSMKRGDANLRQTGNSAATAWGEVRKLTADGVRRLAEEMVKQVRERGPFLSMSEFVNRRLESGSDANSLKGALQTAIDNAGLNSDFNEEVISTAKSGGFYKFPKAAEGSLYTGAPGYLIQSDVLTSLGNILTVRDDTFTVRSYGCVKNKNNAVLSQAWCEATVQRCVDYVDPSNLPTDAAVSNTAGASSNSRPLSKVNKVLGRQFKIVSFKWLDHWDI
ncbi:MAG: hypothetical protein R3Y56_03490 [Akkermansia sp.]